MRNARSAPFSTLLRLALCVAATGCNLLGKDKAAEAAAAAAAAPVPVRPLQDIELPVSLRTSDRPPNDARQLEASDQQLSLDGTAVVALDKGRVPPADKASGIIPKLEARLQSPPRSTIALRFQANLPYETVALVLSTARKIGMSNAAIQVRETGGVTKTGWVLLEGFVLSSKADDVPVFPGIKDRSWNDFTDNWQEVLSGCKTSPTGNCAYLNDNFAQGGTLKQELMASGRGINIDFFRRGLTPQQEAVEDKNRARILATKKEDFLQGRISHDDMVEALLLGDPSTYALFQFRYQEALKSPSKGPSALAKTMAPMCHKQRCGIVLTADIITPLLNVVSMIGAAFPDGTQMPMFAVELPWTERPKPAVLSEWIAQQSAK
jgi:hypothetical protein